jgi:hypothetical protein
MTDPKLGVPYIKEVAAEMAAVLSMDVHEYMMKSRFIDLIQWTGHSFVCTISECTVHAVFGM